MSKKKRRRRNKRHRQVPRLPKLCGADVELGNFIDGGDGWQDTGSIASVAMLREVEGLPKTRASQGGNSSYHYSSDRGASYSGDSNHYGQCGSGRSESYPAREHGSSAGGVLYAAQDWGRRFLPANGGCIYIDLAHLELAMPEVVSAYDHLAVWHAMLRIARRAHRAANEKMPQGRRIQAQVNNTDGRVSWGGHFNVAITRQAWDNTFDRRLHYLTYLASFQVSSIVYTGQGKVGSTLNPGSGFQLSQRADFFETICAPQTTYRRPIVNSRDEALCGSRVGTPASSSEGRPDVARLHVIFFDSILAHSACVLRTGVMQIITAMIEAERVNPALILESPLDALTTWSRDPGLISLARTVSGKRLTAVEHQFLFLGEARRFAEQGGLAGVVPRYEEILDLWEDVLVKLERYDLAALSSQLDWALKLTLLERVLDQNRELDWRSPQLQYLDQLYGSLDPESGLYWSCEGSGAVTRLVSEERIRFFESHPPEDTRAWTRAMLLRRGGAEAIRSVNWDYVTLEVPSQRGLPRRLRVPLEDPFAATCAHNLGCFESGQDLEGLALALGAKEELSYGSSTWKRSAHSGGSHWNAQQPARPPITGNRNDDQEEDMSHVGHGTAQQNPGSKQTPRDGRSSRS